MIKLFDNLGFSHLFFMFLISLFIDTNGQNRALDKATKVFCSHLKMDTAKGIRLVLVEERSRLMKVEPLSGRRRRVNLRQ